MDKHPLLQESAISVIAHVLDIVENSIVGKDHKFWKPPSRCKCVKCQIRRMKPEDILETLVKGRFSLEKKTKIKAPDLCEVAGKTRCRKWADTI